MVIKELLPKNYVKAIEQLDWMRLSEIRLRSNQPLCITYGGKNAFLGESGLSFAEKAFFVDNGVISDVFVRACRNSVYAFDEQIVRGFIDLGEGFRMGICGECITGSGKIQAVRNVTSLCIRIPHEVRGCSLCVREFAEKRQSILVIAPCGAGKTTFLRDLALYLGEKGFNVTVIDERGELAFCGKARFSCCDVVRNCPKQYAFENVIRSMSPDIVVTDEIFADDMQAIEVCVDSGISVAASVHAENIEQAKSKLGGRIYIFDRYVVISRDKKVIATGEICKDI